MNREALLDLLEAELAGLEHGIARLEVHVRDGRIIRAVAGRERSVLVEAPALCVTRNAPERIATKGGRE